MDKVNRCWICGRESDQGACCARCEHEARPHSYGYGLVPKHPAVEWNGSEDNIIKILED